MSPLRWLALLCLVAVAASSVLAQSQQPTPPPAGEATASRTPAEQILDSALQKLAALEWMQTNFRQTGPSYGVRYNAEGRYVVAPKEQKVFYEFNVRVGDARGRIKVVCDGETIWRVNENGPKTVGITYKLADLVRSKESVETRGVEPARIEQLLKDLNDEHGFAGLVPMLQELKQSMTFPRMETVANSPAGEMYVLHGEWTKELREKFAPSRKAEATTPGAGSPATSSAPPRPSPAEQWEKRDAFIRVPRFCKLYLHKESLWPHRVEWYGPTRVKGDDELLLSWEFNDPVLERPKSEVEVSGLFQVSLEEKRVAEPGDPAVFLKSRQERLVQETRLQERLAESRPLEPTLTQPAPGARPVPPPAPPGRKP